MINTDQTTTENLNEYHNRLSREAALGFNATRTRKDGQLRRRPGPAPKFDHININLIDFTNLH